MPNCCLRYCFFSEATKPTNPGDSSVSTRRLEKCSHTDGIKHKTNESVIRRKWKEEHIRKHDVLSWSQLGSPAEHGEHCSSHLEVVYDTLSVQKVVCDSEEIPVQCFSPRILALGFAAKGEQRSDLAVNDRLAKDNQKDHVRVPHSQ
jgi:hypothetical protein